MVMKPSRSRADLPHQPLEPVEPVEEMAADHDSREQSLRERLQATEQEQADTGVGGRQVLAWTLTILAAMWVGLTAWSAGQTLTDQSIAAPLVAQWLAIGAGPLALLGLVWLMFGRTRRRETERFTRSVIGLRQETRSLEGLLSVLRQRIDEEQAALALMADRLMRLGDEASHRLGAVTRDLDQGAEVLARHGAALDRAAESARSDFGVILEDLPRAEATARAMSEELRASGREASTQAAALEAQITAIASRAREADDSVGSAAHRLVAHLNQIESAGASAASRVGEAGSSAAAEVDALLERTAAALLEVRSGIDVQSAAVAALVAQSTAGLNQTGIAAAESLGSRLQTATAALDGLTTRIAEQDRASARLIADIDRGLAQVDQRFVDLAAEGELRAAAVSRSIGQVRNELERLSEQSAANDGSLEALAARTSDLQQAMAALENDLAGRLGSAFGEAESRAERLLAAVQTVRPEVEWMREASAEASDRLALSADHVAQQQDGLAALLASLHDGVGGAEERLSSLRDAIARAQADAANIQAETAPALVQAMVQVREASAHAAERAREAISAVIPGSVQRLSEETRVALSQAIEESIAAQLREVEATAARAVEAARTASERLTGQMLSIGQTAAALEAHMERSTEAQRTADTEAFARRAAILIDSLHSASIDIGKILSDEVDDRAWAAYLKGDRGVFTRRAVRLLGPTETRALATQYESDPEFAVSVNRYVHDFEALLRRVSNERDGGMMAVSLMSSDMGKLYAALAQVVEKHR